MKIPPSLAFPLRVMCLAIFMWNRVDVVSRRIPKGVKPVGFIPWRRSGGGAALRILWTAEAFEDSLGRPQLHTRASHLQRSRTLVLIGFRDTLQNGDGRSYRCAGRSRDAAVGTLRSCSVLSGARNAQPRTEQPRNPVSLHGTALYSGVYGRVYAHLRYIRLIYDCSNTVLSYYRTIVLYRVYGRRSWSHSQEADFEDVLIWRSAGSFHCTVHPPFVLPDSFQ